MSGSDFVLTCPMFLIYQYRHGFDLGFYCLCNSVKSIMHTVESFLHSGKRMQEAQGKFARIMLRWTPDTSVASSSILKVFYAI